MKKTFSLNIIFPSPTVYLQPDKVSWKWVLRLTHSHFIRLFTLLITCSAYKTQSKLFSTPLRVLPDSFFTPHSIDRLLKWHPQFYKVSHACAFAFCICVSFILCTRDGLLAISGVETFFKQRGAQNDKIVSMPQGDLAPQTPLFSDERF